MSTLFEATLPALSDSRLTRLAPNERAGLARFVDGLRERYGDDLLRVVLFGSKARGDFDYNLLLNRNIEHDGVILWTNPRSQLATERPDGRSDTVDEATRRAYIRIRLARANEDLASACSALEQNLFRSAINRAYYAIFHLASAALLWQGIERSRHSGIESAFIQYLVKPGVIEPQFRQIYVRARREHEKQDYDLGAKPPTEQDAQQAVDDATRFVNRIEHYLYDSGALSEEPTP